VPGLNVRRPSLVVAGAVVGGATAVFARRRPWRSIVVDDLLGRRGGPCSRAYGANDAGVVVGCCTGRPFVWVDGRLQLPFERGCGEATAVDRSGVVVGWRASDAGGVPWILADGVEDLPLPPGATSGRALAVDGPLVVGVARSSSGPSAVVWRDGGPRGLASLGGDRSVAHAVSPAGVAVGASDDGLGRSRPCAWIDGRPLDLGTLGGPTGVGRAVSADGRVIVGSASLPTGRAVACLWLDGSPHPLGTLGGPGGDAHGIDGHGRVVGRSTLPDNVSRACVWRDGLVEDLGTLGGQSSTAFAVSPAGAVVGTASTGAGATGVPLRPGGWSWEEHAFVHRLSGGTRGATR
jgi:probable HAF family extracellular repeat protein